MHCVLNFRNQRPRLVDPFSYESKQFNTIVRPPKRLDPYEIRPTKTTLFRYYFQRGDIPIVGTKRSVSKNDEAPGFKWLVENPERLDYCYYLPILIEGLAESDRELRSLAQDAAVDLIIRGYDKLLPTIPVIIMPFKKALNTRDPEIIVNCLKVLQKLVLHGDCVGIALVPYYRQLLPICNLFKTVNVNLGSAIDAQRPNRIGDVIEDTLQILEKFGGPDAYLNIKYMIPTYESNVLNC